MGGPKSSEIERPLSLYEDADENAEERSDTVGGQQCGNAKRDPWKILVVDDEEDVHRMTQLVLRSFAFQGRPVEIHDVYSGAETREFLRTQTGIAVILLDVVMETDDSGLRIVEYLRKSLHNNITRVILRTGQPGSAPENRVIAEYDINDYKEKNELTKQKLLTSITTAIRSYQYVTSIEKSRTELHKIIMAGAKIFQLQSMKDFCQAVLQQLAYLLNIDQPAVHIQTRGFAATYTESDFQILASIGHESEPEEQESVLSEDLLREIGVVMAEEASQYRGKWYIAYFKTSADVIHIMCVENDRPIDPVALDLIRLFNMDVGIAFNNLYLTKEIQDTQRELIYSLGEVIETRSQETSYHVHRVSRYVEFISRVLGLSEDKIETLKIASALHDIGKLAIPDAILNKPGPLTENEMELMKTHAAVGYQLLRSSRRPIFREAAEIAHSHHERWNGTGYPSGLQGDEIPLSARITGLVDVYDALSMDRVYRKAWDIERVIAYIREGAGAQFDPELVRIFLEHQSEFEQIREGVSKEGEEIS